MKILLAFLVTCLASISTGSESNLYYITASSVKFRSEAPLEVISAESTRMLGVIDPDKRTFAFSIQNTSFEGFNSALQRVHFNENYIESDKYPKATFRGKINEFDAASLSGTAKEYVIQGKLEMHGKTKDVSMNAKIRKTDGGIEIVSNFLVNTDDFGIHIPSVVKNKVSKKVDVNSVFVVK